MKKNELSFVFRIFTFLFLSINCYGQISKNVEFKAGDIVKSKFSENGVLYDCLQLKNGESDQIVGNPDLPVFYYTFYVPSHEDVIDVTLKSKQQEVILLTNDLLPVQLPIPTGFNLSDKSFFKQNKQIYESSNAYPSKQVQIHKTNYLDGDLKLVTVEVYPMLYYPKLKKINYSRQFEIILETSKNNNLEVSKTPRRNRDKSIVKMLCSMVENPELAIEDIEYIQNSTTTPLNKIRSESETYSWNVPFYEYVIVTSDALKTSFTELLNWKRQKGYNAGIVTIEEILSDPMATGDEISNLYDDAGKLRQYLKDGYYSNITKYALLGGDYSVIPIRNGCGGKDSWDYGSSIDGQKIPSDLYFSDFNGNWNKDDDIYTGEQVGDQLDFAPEIFVGRLLCNNSNDITNWTKKQLLYEKNPGNGDFSYLGRALFTESDHLQYGNEASYVKSFLPSFIKTNTLILSEVPSYNDEWPSDPTGPNIITQINNVLYGLLSNFNHGGPLGYGTATHGYALYGHDVHSNVVAFDELDMYDSILYSARPEYGNGFDNLTNFNYPAVFYSVSCENMPFDDYYTPFGTRNLGESFTCAHNGGGVAYLGNTRNGWVSYSSSLYKVFLDKLSISNKLGEAEAFSKFTYNHYWLRLSHNLVGCPETPMWTEAPTKFNNATVTLDGSTLNVNSGETDAKIAVTNSLDEVQNYYHVVDNVSNAVFTDVPTSYTVVITKTNYLPFIYESNCFIQNEEFSGSIQITANNVRVGENVTNNKPTGPVIIQSGANVTIDYDGETILMNGFEVKLGGQFEIK